MSFLKCYVSKLKYRWILIPFLLFFIKIIKFYSNNIQGTSVLSKKKIKPFIKNSFHRSYSVPIFKATA